jgi:thioredoxin-related protein
MVTILKKLSLFILLSFSASVFAGDELVFERLNLPAAADSIAEGKPLVLYIGLTNCGFCRRLEAEVMPVLLTSEEYTSQIRLQKILWDSGTKVVWKNGEMVSPDQIAREFRIRATPTLLFLDVEGNQIAKPIEGYRDSSFYWSYLDERIETARLALAK